jgi:hypothetical protein
VSPPSSSLTRTTGRFGVLCGMLAAFAYLLVPALLVSHDLTAHADHPGPHASPTADVHADEACGHHHAEPSKPARSQRLPDPEDSDECRTCLLIGTLAQKVALAPPHPMADLEFDGESAVERPLTPAVSGKRRATPASPRAPPLV